MRMSQLLFATLRETPAEAEVVSHRLMMRADLIRKVAMGLYTFMPLGWRSMKKIEDIVRQEMDAQGCQEMFMPVVQPAELWQESGRWQVYGQELMRMQDRHQRDLVLAPTHEEVITTTLRSTVRSYKQLPQLAYHIQTKFRDERRPRFGVMRCREFVMKDCYSFDRDEEGLSLSYEKMSQAYHNIFSRCGLDYRPVEADSGAIGGSGSHEFMALSEVGESQILFCPDCHYAATDEIAPVTPAPTGLGEPLAEIRTVETPNCKTVEDLARLLQVPATRTVKTLCYMADGQPVVVLLRGDRQLNEIKLQNALHCLELEFANDDQVRAMGMEPGYCGPVGLDEKATIIADREVPLMVNHECGDGRKDFHLLNVNHSRGDYRIDVVADIALAEAGEPCPLCGAPLNSTRGIEVGQIFKLHTKYSDKLNACYVDETGAEQKMVMGCYGIGIARTMAAVIEQHHDDHGIIWPISVAPYEVSVIPVNDKDQELMDAAFGLYRQLKQLGLEPLLDDRRERPGVKFNDADLLGFPIQIILGKKLRESGVVELKLRASGQVRELPLAEAAAEAAALKAEMLAQLTAPFAWPEE